MLKPLQQIADTFQWYHEIEIASGVTTKPAVRYPVSWDLIEAGMLGMDLKGKAVLDVGTRDGKFAFMAEKMGATVTAIDNNASPGALWLKTLLSSQVTFREINLYELTAVDQFDVVLFFGVLYHLRYPMRALKILTKALRLGGMLYIESGMFDKFDDVPLLYCPVRNGPYEPTSCSFFNVMGLSETLWSFGCEVGTVKQHESEAGKDVQRMWIEVRKTRVMPDDQHAYWEGIHASHNKPAIT